MPEVKNAKIVSTMLGFEDRGILTYMIYLDLAGGGSQGFGGYVLGGDYTTKVVKGILEAVGAESWEKLVGKYVRVESESGWNGKLTRIGNLLEDKWFDPKN